MNTRMKNRISGKAAVMLICLIAVITAGCGGRKPPGTRPAAAPDGQKQAPKIEAFGFIRAPLSITIMMELPATVREIKVITGQNVKRGDVLVSLDIGQFMDQIRSAEQNLSIAKLRLSELEKNYAKENAGAAREYKSLTNSMDAARAEIAQLEKDLEQKSGFLADGKDPDFLKLQNDIRTAEADLANARNEAERQKILFKEDAATHLQVEKAQDFVTTKVSALTNLKLSSESLRISRTRELSQLELQLAQKKASLANMSVQLESISTPALTAIEIQREQLRVLESDLAFMRSKLDRPYLRNRDIVCELQEAVVTEIACVQGSILGQGSVALKLADLSSLVAEANIPEEFIRDVKPGDPARVKPVADRSRSYTGTVESISGMAVNNNGETVIPVRIRLQNDGFLRPSFNIDVEIGAFETEPEKQEEPDTAGVEN